MKTVVRVLILGLSATKGGSNSSYQSCCLQCEIKRMLVESSNYWLSDGENSFTGTIVTHYFT